VWGVIWEGGKGFLKPIGHYDQKKSRIFCGKGWETVGEGWVKEDLKEEQEALKSVT